MEKLRKSNYEYTDKDGYEWTVDIEENGMFAHSLNNSFYDRIWKYWIFRKDRAICYYNEIKMMDSKEPTIEDILLDFTTYIISVSLGFSKEKA